MRQLIVGCGYVGMRVARRWREAGHDVFAVSRRPTRHDEFREAGLHPVTGDVTDAASLALLPDADGVLFAVGHDRQSDATIEEVYAGGVKNVVAAMSQIPGRFLYISTTGVYGDHGGEWVDEDVRPEPARAGGRASLAAEQLLATSSVADRLIILRLGGIYGPGRVPFLDKLRCGEPIPTDPESRLNLIHVDDAARIVCELAGREGLPCPLTLNVTDGHPVVRRDYYSAVAKLIAAGPPRFVPPEPNSARADRARASRRISNARLLKFAPAPFEFPSYQQGLAAILGARASRS